VACYHCTFEGHKYANAKKGGMYFCGYAHESPQLITRADRKTVHAWDTSLRKPDAAHRLFCEKVHGELHTLPKTLGDYFGFWGCALWESAKLSLLKPNASWRGESNLQRRVAIGNLLFWRFVRLGKVEDLIPLLSEKVQTCLLLTSFL
jgi:hypothetical protein